jgi:hypothetical protein
MAQTPAEILTLVVLTLALVAAIPTSMATLPIRTTTEILTPTRILPKEQVSKKKLAQDMP